MLRSSPLVRAAVSRLRVVGQLIPGSTPRLSVKSVAINTRGAGAEPVGCRRWPCATARPPSPAPAADMPTPQLYLIVRHLPELHALTPPPSALPWAARIFRQALLLTDHPHVISSASHFTRPHPDLQPELTAVHYPSLRPAPIRQAQRRRAAQPQAPITAPRGAQQVLSPSRVVGGTPARLARAPGCHQVITFYSLRPARIVVRCSPAAAAARSPLGRRQRNLSPTQVIISCNPSHTRLCVRKPLTG